MKEQIRGALEKFPVNVIKDALALLMSGEASAAEAEAPGKRELALEEIKDFVSFIIYAKRNYQFPELKSFVVEGGKVFYTRENKRFLIAREERINEPGKKNRSPGNDRFGQLELEE